jgi:hypothetical protein
MKKAIILLLILFYNFGFAQQTEMNKLTEQYYQTILQNVFIKQKNFNVIPYVRDEKLTFKIEQKLDLIIGNQKFGVQGINAAKGFCYELITLWIYDTEEKRTYFKQNELNEIVFDYIVVDKVYDKQKMRFTISNSDFLSLGYPFLEYEFVEKLEKK